MNRKVVIGVAIGAIFLIGLGVAVAIIASNGGLGWRKVMLDSEKYDYGENGRITLSLDLDGDGKEEKNELILEGKDIYIDDTAYVTNKHYGKGYSFETPHRTLTDYGENYYRFADLNGDGIMEIIHRTFEQTQSPGSNLYTVYNFKDGELREVGDVSIIGSMPRQVYVKGNKVKFKYSPFESPEYIREVEVFELNV